MSQRNREQGERRRRQSLAPTGRGHPQHRSTSSCCLCGQAAQARCALGLRWGCARAALRLRSALCTDSFLLRIASSLCTRWASCSAHWQTGVTGLSSTSQQHWPDGCTHCLHPLLFGTAVWHCAGRLSKPHHHAAGTMQSASPTHGCAGPPVRPLLWKLWCLVLGASCFVLGAALLPHLTPLLPHARPRPSHSPPDAYSAPNAPKSFCRTCSTWLRCATSQLDPLDATPVPPKRS